MGCGHTQPYSIWYECSCTKQKLWKRKTENNVVCRSKDKYAVDLVNAVICRYKWRLSHFIWRFRFSFQRQCSHWNVAADDSRECVYCTHTLSLILHTPQIHYGKTLVVTMSVCARTKSIFNWITYFLCRGRRCYCYCFFFIVGVPMKWEAIVQSYNTNSSSEDIRRQPTPIVLSVVLTLWQSTNIFTISNIKFIYSFIHIGMN